MFLLVVRARAGEFGLKVPCNDQSTLPGVKTPCQHRLAMASNPLAMASNLRAMASIVVVFGLLGRWVCQILAGQEHPSSNCRAAGLICRQMRVVKLRCVLLYYLTFADNSTRPFFLFVFFLFVSTSNGLQPNCAV